MEEQIKVSVIAPVHNTADYLYEFLDSVLGQSLREIEVICVDDGSTDASAEIVEEYMRKDSRLRLVEQSCSGAAVARNAGLELASGKYVIFLDSDDFFERDFLRLMFEQIEEHGAEIAFCGGYTYDCKSSRDAPNPNIFKTGYMDGLKVISRSEIPNSLFQVTSPAPWNKLYSRKFIIDNELRFQNVSNTNDLYFFVTAFASARSIVCVPDRLVYYRINRPGSIQINDRERHPKVFASALDESRVFLEEHGLWLQLKSSFIVFALEVARYNMLVSNSYKTYYSVFEAAHDVFLSFKDELAVSQFKVEEFYWLASQYADGEPNDALFAIWKRERDERMRIEREASEKRKKMEKQIAKLKSAAGNPSLVRKLLRKVKRKLISS